MVSRLIVSFVGASVIDHGLMLLLSITLLLSIAKWHNLLNSQLPVYDGDRQAPLDLSNLLPEGTDPDPDDISRLERYCTNVLLACLTKVRR